MSPGLLFLACVLLTGAGLALDVAAHRRRGRALRALAAEWRMHYNAGDQLRLATKVLPRLPVPGAANVRVMDLIYGSDRDRYRYVFSVEYTVGVVGPKRRVVRVASLSEPRERGHAGPVSLTIAPEDGSMVDQYCSLAPPARIEASQTGPQKD